MKYRFFNIPIEVRSECPEIGGHLEALYGAFQDRSSDPPMASYQVNTLNGGSQYAIFRNGESVEQYNGEETFLMWLEQMILDDVMRRVSDMVFIHAAVLANGSEAAIFPGASGSGKSTLALALASRGLLYLSDDIAPVEKKELRVHPFPKGIKVRPNVFRLFPFLQDIPRPTRGERQYLGLRECPLSMSITSHQVSYVIFPRYQPGGKPRLTPISKAIATSVLAKCCLPFDWQGGDTLLVLGRLVKIASCFTFDVGDLVESSAVIENLLQNG